MTGHHSGDIGDIIYGIPAFRAAGIDTIILNPAPTWGTSMGLRGCESLRPLLESQGFNVHIGDGSEPLGDGTSVSLDTFRHGMQDLTWTHLSLSQAKALGVDVDLSARYITGIEPHRVADVVVHRSPRYHNQWFAWKMLLSKADSVVAIGSPEEVALLSLACGRRIEHYLTDDFLEVARVIRGAKVFIGNQSSPFAIAEGLKANRVQETMFGIPNAIPQTANGISVQVMEHVVYARSRLKGWLNE